MNEKKIFSDVIKCPWEEGEAKSTPFPPLIENSCFRESNGIAKEFGVTSKALGLPEGLRNILRRGLKPEDSLARANDRNRVGRKVSLIRSSRSFPSLLF